MLPWREWTHESPSNTRGTDRCEFSRKVTGQLLDKLFSSCKWPWNRMIHVKELGLPCWLRQERSCLQCRRPGFNPWLGKSPWRREQQPTPVFLPGESHGQRSLAGYSPWGHKELDTAEQLTCTHTHTHTHTHKELETLSLQGTTVAFFGGLLRKHLFPGRLDDMFLAYPL